MKSENFLKCAVLKADPPSNDYGATGTLKAETLSKARSERVAGIRTRFSVVADQAAEEESAFALVIG